MRLYTRSGDKGETSLFGGERVSKADSRVSAYGDVDELNAWLGFVLATGADPDVQAVLEDIQRDLFAIGAALADPHGKRPQHSGKGSIDAGDVSRLEGLIDRFDAEPPSLTRFILPGGTSAGAALHLARAVCRRTERQIVSLDPPAENQLLVYINRLSDLLFALARAVNYRTGKDEREW
jgi:cob(I)alamin adenosyltransferase